jgi:phosphoribosylformylglycinamidine synthase PurS subunit
MPRSEILDPQGQAVHAALARLGVSGVRDVRQGKRFEIEIDGELDGELDETTLARLRDAADGLLANPVIETWTLTVQS